MEKRLLGVTNEEYEEMEKIASEVIECIYYGEEIYQLKTKES